MRASPLARALLRFGIGAKLQDRDCSYWHIERRAGKRRYFSPLLFLKILSEQFAQVLDGALAFINFEVHDVFGRFALAAIGATLLWTSGLFYISLRLGTLMMHYLGVWRWAGLAVFLMVLVMVGRLATRIYDKRTSS